MSELPEPLVPAEVDLRGMPWMPVETDRLMNSDLWAISTPEEFKTAFRMWMKAWQQVPAGSLPDDDRILAELSGVGRRWARLRPMALRGFVKCSDGRLYHPVIAPKAIEAWKFRQQQRERANKRWHPSGSPAAPAAADATAMQGTETVKGKGQGQGNSGDKQPQEKNPLSAAARRRSDDPAVTGPVWTAYAQAYQQRYSVEPLRNAKVNGQLAQFLNRVPKDEAPEIAAFYVQHGKGLYVSARHCVDLLLRDAEGLRTEWFTGRRVTETGARQSDRTAERGAVFNDLIDEVREKTA